MTRQVQGVILLLLGVAVLKATVLSDIYLRYVKESLRPFLIAAGVMLLLTGLMALIDEWRQGAAADEVHEGHDDHDAGPVHHESRAGWMLIAPVLGLLLVAPPALGAFAAQQSGSVVLREQDLYPPLPSGDPVRLGMLDYAGRAIFDQGRSMLDPAGSPRRVLLSGFLSPGPDGAQVLTRMTLSCCAADAQPVKVAMTGTVPAGLPADQWIEIIGRYTPVMSEDPVNGTGIPAVEVLEWRPIDPPRNQYE